MNIFFTDNNPEVAARNLTDQLVVKMIIESSQMLFLTMLKHNVSSILYPISVKGTKYKVTKAHSNHPSTKWVYKSRSNYMWLLHHLIELCNIYKNKSGRQHHVESSGNLKRFLDASLKLEDIGLTRFHVACSDPFPKEKYLPDIIECYRAYLRWKLPNYVRIHTYSDRSPPDWINYNECVELWKTNNGGIKMKQYKTFHPLQFEDGFEFKDGDIVSYGGVEDIVKRIENCVILNDSGDRFISDGKKFLGHTEPTLILIERPKKMVEKTVETYVTDEGLDYIDGIDGLGGAPKVSLFKSETFKNKIKITYEVEE